MLTDMGLRELLHSIMSIILIIHTAFKTTVSL